MKQTKINDDDVLCVVCCQSSSYLQFDSLIRKTCSWRPTYHSYRKEPFPSAEWRFKKRGTLNGRGSTCWRNLRYDLRPTIRRWSTVGPYSMSPYVMDMYMYVVCCMLYVMNPYGVLIIEERQIDDWKKGGV